MRETDKSANIAAGDQLARLLANENIQVVRGNFKTAAFDTKKRLLMLPNWEKLGTDIMKMLTGHEVGHAIFTPENFIKLLPKRPNLKALRGVYNVVEDIRIERMIQSRYPGLKQVFNRAYEKLVATKFFGDTDKITSFADFLNYHGKTGIKLKEYNEREQELVNAAFAAESNDEVMKVVADIYDYLDEQNQQQQNQQNQDQGDSKSDSDGDSKSDSDGDSKSDSDGDDSSPSGGESGDDDGEDNDTSSKAGANGAGNTDTKPGDAFDIKTNDQLEKAIAENHEKTDIRPSTVRLPNKQTFEKSIIDYKKLQAEREKCHGKDITNGAKFRRFIKGIDSYVALLVREFNSKKAARAYERSSVSETGSLDMSKLHGYKTSDNLFLQVRQLKIEKNHGVFMLVDFSGSMSFNLGAALTQVLILTRFCQKVSIPFKVYAFTTTGWGERDDGQNDYMPNDIYLGDTRLVELLNSKMRKQELDYAMASLHLRKNRRTNHTNFESLGGTPLDEALAMSHRLVRDFKGQNRLEKVTFITVTDGDGGQLQACAAGQREFLDKMDEDSVARIQNGCYGEQGLVYPPSNYVFEVDHRHSYRMTNRTSTADYLKSLRAYTGCDMVGFFIVDGERDFQKVRGGSDKPVRGQKPTYSDFKNDGFASFVGYRNMDRYFALNSDFLEPSSDEALDPNASVAAAQKRFAANAMNRRKTRALATQFIGVLA